MLIRSTAAANAGCAGSWWYLVPQLTSDAVADVPAGGFGKDVQSLSSDAKRHSQLDAAHGGRGCGAHFVLVSIHTTAVVSGLPVALLQATAVSRWFVIPRPLITGLTPRAVSAFATASRMHVCTFSYISIGSCSTQLRTRNDSRELSCETVPNSSSEMHCDAPSLRHDLLVR